MISLSINISTLKDCDSTVHKEGARGVRSTVKRYIFFNTEDFAGQTDHNLSL